MNLWMSIGVAIQVFFGAALLVTRALPPWIALVVAGFAGLSLLGAALVAAGRVRVGGRLVFVGSIAFIPIGFIAILGARKALDRVTVAAAEVVPDRLAPRQLFVRPGYRKMMLGIGVAVTALGAATLAMKGQSTGLAVGVALIGFSIWWGKNPVIRLFKTRMEMKVSPFAARQVIEFDAVQRIYRKGKKKVLITVAEGEKTRELPLPRQLLDDGDFRALEGTLESAAA